MKYTRTIFALAVLGASLISCSRSLSPVEGLQNLDSEVAKLNNNIAVIQAVGLGEVINSVKSNGSDYSILLCNGRELSLSGSISANAPEISVSDGIWTVGGEALRCGGSEEGLSVEVLPEASVNAEGEWTLSAEGLETVLGKAIATVATPYFETVSCSETQLSLKTKSAATLSGTVAAGFLFQIDAAGTQEFTPGQTRTFTVTRNGVKATTVVVPEGWAAELTETQISITAPSTVSTKAVLADSKTDVSVIAVSTEGYVTIAKMETSLLENVQASATLTLGTVEALSAEVTVVLENQTAWYYILQEATEIAPSAAEIKAASTGSDTNLTFNTSPETSYTLYVLPVNGDTDGSIAKISFTTTALTSYYEAWEAGKEIKIGSQIFSKANNGAGKLITGNTNQSLYSAWVNNSTFGAYFIEEGSTIEFNGNDYTGSIVIIGNVPGKRPTVNINAGNTLTGSNPNVVFSNVSLDIKSTVSNDAVFYNNAEIGRLILNDCRVNLTRPMFKRFNAAGNMAGIEVLGCDVCVNWASTSYQLVNTHAGGANLGDITVKNNIFWSASDKKEFHLCASPWENYTAFNDIVLKNNTFYNVNNGLLSSGRYKALIMASTVNSFSTGANIAYDTAPDSKTVDTRPHFTWLKANGKTLEELKTVTTVSENSLINIAEYCGLWGSDSAEFGYGLTSLITWKTGGYTEIDSWINPFASEDAANGIFTVKSDYAGLGAQR